VGRPGRGADPAADLADDRDRGVTAGSRGGPGLRGAIDAGRFAVTAELDLPHGIDPERVGRKAAALSGWVDAVNVTDNPGASVMPSSMAGSVLAMRAGLEPVMQLTCRDRNRIALQSDLLGAGLLGIPNVLLLTGDHPRFGDHPGAKPVFDLDSVSLTGTARALRDTGRLLSGRTVAPAPSWLVGAVENPFAAPQSFRAARLAKKVAAGAEFVQTQFVFDVPLFARWMAEVRDLGVSEHCAVLAGIGPIRSARALNFMRTEVPGIHIPEDVVRRLSAVPADRFAAEGVRLCVETAQQVREIAGVAGVHVMVFGKEGLVPEILEAAGIGPRPVSERSTRHAG
jgi:methylenetetrahydrofolate reductase (NADPH)